MPVRRDTRPGGVSACLIADFEISAFPFDSRQKQVIMFIGTNGMCLSVSQPVRGTPGPPRLLGPWRTGRRGTGLRPVFPGPFDCRFHSPNLCDNKGIDVYSHHCANAVCILRRRNRSRHTLLDRLARYDWPENQGWTRDILGGGDARTLENGTMTLDGLDTGPGFVWDA